MRTYRQFEPLLVEEFEVSEWKHPLHKHNHYELIYIRHGAGTHQVNQNILKYKSGDIFLIGPEEEHSFKIDSVTGFVYIKFTDAYLHRDPGFTLSVKYLEYLIKSRETHLSGFSLREADEKTVSCIIDVVRSLQHDLPGNEHLIWLQVLALATLMQRNMPELKSTLRRTTDMQAIFCYLHKFVYEPAKWSSSALANHFNRSPDYIGPYFKRNTGVTLREYIGQYRRTLIKQRLDSGNYSLKQIAAEFSLTDESHVSKIMSRLHH